MGYRVEQVAAMTGISVDTVRYYQSRGLLSPPQRDGRVALYEDEHLDRIRQVRSLQRRGLTLEAIRRVVGGRLSPADRNLAVAVAVARDEDDREETLTLEELAQRSGVAGPLIQSLEANGVPVGRTVDGETRYTRGDVEVLRIGLRLVEAGLPLTELMALAADHHRHTVTLANRAVELFDTHVRRPIRARSGGDEEASKALVEAFSGLFPAVSSLVELHFRRVLLGAAEERMG